MHNPLHWLFQQAGQAITPGAHLCYLCGHDCTESHLVSKVIADTFNSHWRAQCRSSAFLCDACAWYLDSKAGHADYRKMSLVVTETIWRNWQRADMKTDIARWLASGIEEDAYLVVSLSKKKHILLQAPLNAGHVPSLAIQVEEQQAYFGASDWHQIEQPFMALLALGHNKGEILSGDLYANTLRKHGQLSEAMRLNTQLDPWRNSPLIELYSYTTIIEEKGTKEVDGTGRGESTERTGAGDATDRRCLAIADGGMEEHRPRVQESVQSGDLATIRGTHSSSGTDDGNAASVSQSSLWDV
jgi:hypothetical protein